MVDDRISDQEILTSIGNFIHDLRLKSNITQKMLASRAGVSINSIKALESGCGKLSVFVIVLRELNALEYLDDFIKTPEVSPLQLAKLHGKQRQRASRKLKDSSLNNKDDNSTW